MLPVIAKVLVAAGAHTGNGNSGSVAVGSDLSGALFILDVASVTGSGTLDVSIEDTNDGGTTWFEVLRFTQVTAAAQHQILVNLDRRLDAGVIRAVTTGGTGALNANVPLSDPVRVKWVFGGSMTASNFSVSLIANRRQV